MYVRVCLCVSSLCLCELLFAGYRTSYWQAIENPWLRDGKGEISTPICCLLLLMPAINIATDCNRWPGTSLFEAMAYLLLHAGGHQSEKLYLARGIPES